MSNVSKSPDPNLKDKAEIDRTLEQALKDFRSSVHAWSEAAYSLPHLPVKIHRTSWRMAVAWALGCVLVSGSVAGGLYERHHKQELARMAMAAEAARQQKLAERQQRAQKENQDLLEKGDLLAKVDSDVSRSVPSAMEPLAQLMSEDETQ